MKRGRKGDFRQKVLVFRLAQRLLNASRQMNTVELDVQTPFLTEGELVVQLPLGLLGFEEVKKYSLTRIPGEEPFLRFKALDESELSFLVLSPFEVLPDYSPDIPAEDVQFLCLETPEDAMVYNIVTIRPNGQSTLNLKGPLVINRFSLTGKQVVIANASEYSVQHPLPVLE